MRNIKVIFFDMGNTLLHFHFGNSDYEKDMKGLIYLTQYLNRFNDNIQLNDVKIGFYNSWMNGIKDRRVRNIEYPIENFLNDFLKEYNLKLKLEECVQAIKCFYTEYIKQLVFEDNLRKDLETIKEKGYKIGVISNTCYYETVMEECFKEAGIYDLIDEFTFSYSLRFGKPDERIFKIAIEKIGVLPQETIMIGDSLESDIKPALQLGMKTIWLNKDKIKNDSNIIPNLTICKISEILNYI